MFIALRTQYPGFINCSYLRSLYINIYMTVYLVSRWQDRKTVDIALVGMFQEGTLHLAQLIWSISSENNNAGLDIAAYHRLGNCTWDMVSQ